MVETNFHLEISFHVLNFLGGRDLCAITQTSKRWYMLMETEQRLWHNLCRSNWPSCELNGLKSWKELYYQNIKLEHHIRSSPSPGILFFHFHN